MHFLDELSAEKRLTLEHASDAIRLLRKQVLVGSPDPQRPGPGIVDQEELVDRILIALVLGEHCLLEGNPGLAKTLTSQTLGQMAGLAYRRIQFMPDMMPSDLILKEFLEIKDGQTRIIPKRGPLFTNILLADEINRASPKAQAALLEACGEGHATLMHRGREVIRPYEPYPETELLAKHGPFFGVGTRLDGKTRTGQVFVVIATQNPIEQEGVYPLSKAQEDRFLFKLILDYPHASSLGPITEHAFAVHEPIRVEITPEQHVKSLYFFMVLRQKLLGAESREHWYSAANAELRERVETLINFSHYRPPGTEHDGFGAAGGSSRKLAELEEQMKRWEDDGVGNRAHELRRIASAEDRGRSQYPDVLSGASPRGLLGLVRALHVRAFIQGRIEKDHVTPSWEDVIALAPDVLRHRVRLTPGFEAMGARSDTVIQALLRWIERW